MATVTKDFRIKSGLVVEGANATVNGSDIITEDIITGGTQTNISVTYNPVSKSLDFVAENGVADSTTNDLVEGTDNSINGGNNLYFTTERARNSISVDATGPLTYNSNTGELDLATGNGIQVDVDGTLRVKDSYIDTLAKGAVSVDANGPLTYNPTTGEFDLALSPNSGLQINAVDEALELENIAQSVGTFGSTTLIPSITVDSKGRVTNVTVNDVATNLSIAGDSGTDTVDLLNDTLTFAGGQAISTGIIDNQVSVSLNIGTGLQLNQATDSVEINDAIVATVSGQQELQTKTLKDATLGNDLNAANHKITNLSDPVDPQDAATKAYVDGVAQGLDIKESVRAATGSDISNLADVVNTNSFDGVTVVTGDRVLVKSQTNPAQNGIYVVTQENNGGAFVVLDRAADADEPAELNAGTFVFVEEGTAYGDTGWVVSSNNPLTIGTDPMVWTQFSGAGTYTAGYGLTLTGTEFAVDNAEIASQGDLSGAVADLTAYVDGFLNSNDGTVIEYIDAQDQATLLAANTFSTDLVATGDATATPQYLALNVNDLAKQVASQVSSTGSGQDVVYQFDGSAYRTAKFLVKIGYGTHTQVSEVLLTLDTSDNIAITEYAVVGTNGSLGDITATYGVIDVITNGVSLIVNSASSGAKITVMGTLLV